MPCGTGTGILEIFPEGLGAAVWDAFLPQVLLHLLCTHQPLCRQNLHVVFRVRNCVHYLVLADTEGQSY